MNPGTHHEANYYSRSKSRERRAGQRYPFHCVSRVMEIDSSTCIQARTSDVDRGGCFVDTMNSFGVGTIVMLHVTRQNRSFKTRAKVVHSEIGMGMCLAFANPESSELWTLDSGSLSRAATKTPRLRAAKQDHQVIAGKTVEERRTHRSQISGSDAHSEKCFSRMRKAQRCWKK